MIRIVWAGIVLCLFIGIFYLGGEIFDKPGEMKRTLREAGSRMEDKIVGLTENATRMAAEKIHNVVKQTIKKNETQPMEKTEPGKVQKETIAANHSVSLPSVKPAAEPSDIAENKDQKRRGSVAVSPDEAIDPQMVSQPGFQIGQKRDIVPNRESLDKGEETERPFDMNRLNRIRDLHVKAIELLQWN